MAFEWTAQPENSSKTIDIKTLGVVVNEVPGNRSIVTNNATVAVADQLGKQAKVTESATASAITISKEGNDGPNAYVLPWKPDFATKTQLGPNQNLFFTPNLNGCGIIISGSLAEPTIVHVNSQDDILFKNQPDTMAAVTEFNLSYKSPMWDGIYNAVAIKMVAAGMIPRENLKTLFPTEYLTKNVGFASVFGVRSGGAWSLYYSVNGTTRRLWP